MHIQNDKENISDGKSKKKKLMENGSSVDSKLELSDSTPDIHQLFEKFDSKYFGGLFSRKNAVKLKWSKSKHMYKSAGTCYQETNQFGKSATIRLSQPLLSFRPKLNLIETLLVNDENDFLTPRRQFFNFFVFDLLKMHSTK